MAVAAEVIVAVLVAVLLLATAITLFVGLMGALFSEGFARCPRCHHWTLAVRRSTHPHGCPESLPAHAAHAVHQVQEAVARVHLRHH